MDIVRQSLGTGGFHRLDPIRQHGAQDLDHLPVTAGLTFQLAPHTADRDWQLPFLEGGAVAQGTGLAGQDGDVMQGIEDRPVPPERPCVAADNPAILPAFQPVGIGPDLDRPPNRPGIDRVAVLVEPHEAGVQATGSTR